MPTFIQSTADDPRLEPYHDLRSNRRWASPDGFIIETELVLGRLIDSDFQITELVLSPTKAQRLKDTIPPDTTVYVLERTEIERLIGFDLHRGVLARGSRPKGLFPAPLRETPTRGNWLFGENITDPGNVGTLIRIAATLGFCGAYFDPSSSNPYSRRAIRASAGHIFRIPVDTVPTSELLEYFHNGTIYAAALRDDAQTSFHLEPDDGPTLLAVGNEGFGLSHEVLTASKIHVRIPMVQADDSLNVATAAAILCHQLSHLRAQP